MPVIVFSCNFLRANIMKSVRTLGVFLVACSALCFIMAWDRYQSAIREGKAIAEALKGIEFESVSAPVESIVGGLIGVVLLVAGARLIFDSIAQRKTVDNELLETD